jgi:DNA-binding CsgD family transcriptional regulator
MSRFKLDEGRRAELLRLWREGVPTSTLAARFGLSPQSVWRYCESRVHLGGGLTRAERSRAEARRRKDGRRTVARLRREDKAARDAEIRRRWAEGCPGVELAEEFGLSKATVSGIVAGLARPRRYGDPWDVAWPCPRRQASRPDRPASRAPIGPVGTLPRRELAPKGSAHGRAVLNEAKVARIKRLGLDGRSAYSIAREFGVSDNTICNVLKGRNWGHVEPAPATNGGDR